MKTGYLSIVGFCLTCKDVASIASLLYAFGLITDTSPIARLPLDGRNWLRMGNKGYTRAKQ